MTRDPQNGSALVVSGSRDRTVRIWSFTTGKALHVLTDCKVAIIDIAVSRRGSKDNKAWIAAATKTNSVCIWSLSTIFNWERRKAFLMALSGSGLLPSPSSPSSSTSNQNIAQEDCQELPCDNNPAVGNENVVLVNESKVML
eukprot:gene4888-6477_t